MPKATLLPFLAFTTYKDNFDSTPVISNYTRFFFLLILTLIVYSGRGSHIRAGEITAERLSNNTFKFTLTIYGNKLSDAPLDSAIFDFGDGTRSNAVFYTSNTDISSEIYVRVFQTTHSYTGSGYFRVTYQEEWRVANIRNISNSGIVPLFLETMVSISSQSAGNQPPYLQVPPIDDGKVGVLFTHNAGAVDPDGDSLSYKLVVPKASSSANVPGYFQPEASISFTLNPVTGDLVWNTPMIAGLYNVAFIIEEWKKAINGYVRISYITRDMQIKIENSPNNPPVVHIPEDTCIEANTTLNATITATDPDFDLIRIQAFPDDYFSISNPQASPASGNFSWTTTCADVKRQPYFFVFKAEDLPIANPYADIKTWQVKVIAPAPTGLTATGLAASINLTWDPYSCTNALFMDIYRISCDSLLAKQTVCQSGIQGFPGYTKIASIPATSTSYSDATVKQGLRYCYIIAARFPSPGSGESYASLQACASLNNNVPTITSVSVVTTSTALGQISISWQNPSSVAGPYIYNIYRSDDNGATYNQVASNVTSPYADPNLNTLDGPHFYKIELANQGFSAAVSSTYLSTEPSHQTVDLSWDETSSWFNDSLDVYRSINGAAYTFLTRIKPDDGNFTDNPLVNCDTVCYYIQRYHHYCLPGLTNQESQLSQISCSVPKDNRPADGPTLQVTGCNGNLDVFANVLTWTDVSDPNCPNIISYNIYYSEHSGSGFKKLANVPFNQLNYTHIDSQSTAGCYIVKAVNYDSIEGKASNQVCVDDCVFYELPNLITPNGDSNNDMMNPFPIPRGVELVKLSVYNSWGQLVYQKETGPTLNWPGKDSEGLPLNDGVYFFSAEVQYFRRLNPEDEQRLIKGWVHVLDQRNTHFNE